MVCRKELNTVTFAHLTLATRDVVATADFFCQTMGWTKIYHPDNIESQAAWLYIALNQQLHLLYVPDFEPSACEREFGRHVAFFHPNADFSDLKQRLSAHGAEIMEPERATPFERFFFRDPQGYVFEVIDQEGFLTA